MLAYDIFINNAQSGYAQTELLFAVFARWQNHNKIIINMSSNSSDGNKSYLHPYAVTKAALDKACEQLNHIPGSLCKVVNLRPGWIRTERIEKMKISDPCLEIQSVIDTVDFVLALPKNVHISSLAMVAR